MQSLTASLQDRITIRLEHADKHEIKVRAYLADMTVSETIRKLIIFINTLPESEAQAFLHMVKKYKPLDYMPREDITATLRG